MTTATEAPSGEPRTVSAVGATVEVAGLDASVRRARGARRARPRGQRRRGRRHRRALGLRQVDAAGAVAGLREPERGTVASRRRARPGASGWPRCAYMPQRDLLLPWLTALDNAALAPRIAAPRGRTPGGEAGRCSSASASPGSSRRGRPSSPAGCASGSPSCARCWRASRCCCSTSRSPRSTRSPGPRCRTGSPERCAEQPATVLLVTHDVEEALYLSDRVAVLTPRPARVLETELAAARAGRDRERRHRRRAFAALRERALAALARGTRDEARSLLPLGG